MSLLINKVVGYIFVNYTTGRIVEMKHINENMCVATNNRIEQRIKDSNMQIGKVIPAKNKGSASDLTVEFSGSEDDLDLLYDNLQEVTTPEFGIEKISVSYDIVK